MAVASASTQLADFLGSNGSPHQIRHYEGLKALHHFLEATCHTFGGDMITQVMHQVVGNNVWEYPFLTHMVIAVSSGHQRRLLGQSSNTKRLRSLGLEEMSHWQIGLQMFQSKLSRQTSGSEPELMNFDSVVSAIFLTIVFTLAMQDGNAENRSTAQEEDFVQRIIDPMSSTGGFRALQAIQVTPSETSVWMSALDTADDPNGTFTSRTPGTEGLPTAFVQLCELDEHSSSVANPYHAILRHLTPLLQMKPAPRNWSKLFAFSGRLHSTFRPLVAERDPRALLLLAWWLALLRQVDEWWIRAWARSECESVVAYLSGSTDPRVQSLLMFPTTFGTADISWIWGEELDST